MDEPALRERLAAFLDQAGLGEVAPSLRPAYRRERSEVWSAVLGSQSGDAWMELFVYDLAADPAGLIDVNEERLALSELAKVQPGDLVPQLVAESVTDDLAVLVAARPADAAMLLRYLGRAEPGTGLRLTYQPQLDRLFGADLIEEVDGGLLASWLMSVARARLLVDAMSRLADAAGVTGKDELPFPCPVAAFVAEIPEGTGIEFESLGEVPPEYAELAWLQSVVTSGEPLGVHPSLPPGAPAEALAQRLFTTLRVAHRLPATFSRAGGCCLRGEFVTAAGELTDVYFLTAADELNPAQLERCRLTDIANAVSLLSEAIAEPEQLERAFQAAITAYLGPDAPAELLGLAGDTAAQTAGERTGGVLSAPLAALTRALYRAADLG